MDLELRTVRDDERDEFVDAVATGFGMHSTPDDDEYPIHLVTSERSLAVFDTGTIVATAAAIPFRITVPGGAQVPVAGVTDVTVHPTHRRRGLLRRMMRELLDDVARRGEPFAALTASEASIYERFGYGTATFTTRWELAAEYAHLLGGTQHEGAVRLVDGDAAATAAHAVYRRVAPARVGEIERPPEWWTPLFAPGPRDRRFFTAVLDGPDGRPDAFARYALDQRWIDAVPEDTLRVIELQAVDAAAERAMWSYLFGIDLVGTIVANDRPIDEPLRWQLPDARRLRVRQLRDHLWLRVVDVAAALSARTYSADDLLAIEVDDEADPERGGVWRIECGTDGASCARTEGAPDLTLGAAELGAVALGGVAFSTLAAAGRVREHTTGAIRRADRCFLAQPRPWTTTHF